MGLSYLLPAVELLHARQLTAAQGSADDRQQHIDQLTAAMTAAEKDGILSEDTSFWVIVGCVPKKSQRVCMPSGDRHSSSFR